MKKVFITGGCGFIGSHLFDLLMRRDYEVTVYDNLVSGKLSRPISPATGGLDSIKFFNGSAVSYHGSPRFHIFINDVLDAPALEHAMAGHDCVWHLAARPLVAGDGRYDNELRNNFLGTVNVLEAMRKCGVKEILFASTGAVYGDEPGKYMAETQGPLFPISLYAASKLASEAFISAYSHLFGIEAWIFRFANVIGGNMDRGVIHDFIKKLRANPKELEVWGDGLGKKPYFLVEDCLAGMLCAYHAPRERHCDTYNLGADTLTAVDRVAQIVIEEMKLGDVPLRHTGGRCGFPGDVPTVDFDTMKMARLDWHVQHSSEQAVRIATKRLLCTS